MGTRIREAQSGSAARSLTPLLLAGVEKRTRRVSSQQFGFQSVLKNFAL
jgi:hypothetical protein